MAEPTDLSIGETARRSGLTVATLRYYEQRGLISPVRTAGNQRRSPDTCCDDWPSSPRPSASG